MIYNLLTAIFSFVLSRFQARWTYETWVANRADPTQVQQFRWGPFSVTASWGYELKWNGKRFGYGDRGWQMEPVAALVETAETLTYRWIGEDAEAEYYG